MTAPLPPVDGPEALDLEIRRLERLLRFCQAQGAQLQREVGVRAIAGPFDQVRATT